MFTPPCRASDAPDAILVKPVCPLLAGRRVVHTSLPESATAQLCFMPVTPQIHISTCDAAVLNRLIYFHRGGKAVAFGFFPGEISRGDGFAANSASRSTKNTRRDNVRRVANTVLAFLWERVVPVASGMQDLWARNFEIVSYRGSKL